MKTIFYFLIKVDNPNPTIKRYDQLRYSISILATGLWHGIMIMSSFTKAWPMAENRSFKMSPGRGKNPNTKKFCEKQLGKN